MAGMSGAEVWRARAKAGVGCSGRTEGFRGAWLLCCMWRLLTIDPYVHHICKYPCSKKRSHSEVPGGHTPFGGRAL